MRSKSANGWRFSFCPMKYQWPGSRLKYSEWADITFGAKNPCSIITIDYHTGLRLSRRSKKTRRFFAAASTGVINSGMGSGFFEYNLFAVKRRGCPKSRRAFLSAASPLPHRPSGFTLRVKPLRERWEIGFAAEQNSSTLLLATASQSHFRVIAFDWWWLLPSLRIHIRSHEKPPTGWIMMTNHFFWIIFR